MDLGLFFNPNKPLIMSGLVGSETLCLPFVRALQATRFYPGQLRRHQ